MNRQRNTYGRFINDSLVGKGFGRLLVLKEAPRRTPHRAWWTCRCSCGNMVITNTTDLKTGNTQSCGCLQKDRAREANLKHGDNCKNKTRHLYRVWASMKRRCYNPKNQNYKYYGGKNIEICEEWKSDYIDFKNWALANGYKENLSINRIHSNENYCPNNCEWIPLSENQRRAALQSWQNKGDKRWKQIN